MAFNFSFLALKLVSSQFYNFLLMIDQLDFKDLFNQFYELIKNFLYYKTKDIDVANDLAQETFLIVWNNREKVKLQTVDRYLYKIANNLFINHYKHQKVVYKHMRLVTPAVFNETPEFVLEEKEFKKKLENSIASIPEKSRTVFLMNRIDKLTYAEIAKRLNLSEKAIEKRMQKALVILREKIGKL